MPIQDDQERKVSVVVTDLDNTLWNWFEIWHSSFRPFLDELVRVTGIPEDVLKREIKKIHEQHHTSEYSHVLQELPTLRARFGDEFDPRCILPTVIEAYTQGRKSVSKLYEGVVDTLNYIRERGAITVGFTESQFYYTTQRIRTLGLDGLLTHLYSTEDRGTIPIDSMRRFPGERYELKETRTNVLPTNSKKPDSSLLLSILSNLKANILGAIYIGDDLGKDVSMANSANVPSVHAAYGVAHRDSRYQLLVDVTHWTDEDVKRQAAMTEKQVHPDFVLQESFTELREHFVFVPYTEW